VASDTPMSTLPQFEIRSTVASADMTIVTIHIYLPEEAVDCWYPVQAEHLGDDRYRILEEPENDPVLEFHRGEIVRVDFRNSVLA
jgi:hypothetical protein